MRKYLITSLLISCLGQSYSQVFKAEAKLPTIAQDGFFRIILAPEEVHYLNADFSNARIFDAKNAEVPYIVTEEQASYLQQQFKEYDIVDKRQGIGAYTALTLRNQNQISIDNISLLIKNAEVRKVARLSGSDDQKTWFAVKENFTFDVINNSSAVDEVRAVQFPLTNYTYYLLEISDSSSAPLNILKAGYYDVTTTSGLYAEIPVTVSATIDEKEHKTYLKLSFKQAQLVDKIDLSMTGSPFFQRSGVVTIKQTQTVKKKQREYDQFLTGFTVRSQQTTVISLDETKGNELTLSIENGDNAPLSIQSLKVYQLNRYLVAWLKKDEAYTIKFGEDNIGIPDYDLAYFRDSIPENPQVLKMENLRSIETGAVKSEEFFTNKAIIWIAIGAVIVLLAFMSRRLIQDTTASQNDQP